MEEITHVAEPLETPPDRPQFSFPRLFRMGWKSLRHQRTSSLLQFATIAASASFVSFVLGELVVLREAETLFGGGEEPLGSVPQLLWILAVSLLVCTISNVTSTLLCVARRFREIGTMKCLGAFDGTVLALFLMEALVLGIAGSVAGAFLGSLVSLVRALAGYGPGILSASLFLGLLGRTLGTVLLASGLTLLGAAYPAWRAGRMLPVEAMRST